MAKDPAFLFYSSDFDMGTKFFTDEQVGKYIRLLIAQHQHGRLKESYMLKICGNYDEDIFEKFSKDNDGLYYNKRLDEEIIKRKKHSEKQRENIMKRWNKCNSNENTKEIPKSYDGITMVIPLENKNEIENININNNSNINKLFNEYLEIRRKKKYTITDSVINRLINKLNEYGITDEDKEEILLKAITGGWKDFYPLEKSKIIEKTPEWLDKDIKEARMTPKELAEFEKELSVV